MDITTEEQAAKVRAVMSAMIVKLQAAKESSDKAAVADLRAQYTTLQNALQEYKQRTRTEQRDTIQAYRDTIAQLKEELRSAKEEQRQAQTAAAEMREQVTAAKKTIGDLKFEVARLKDENHSLRTPPAPLNTSTSFNMTPYNTADWNFTHADLEAEFDRVLGPRGA